MEARKPFIRSVLQWAFAIACAIVLWFAGYRMGGVAGGERGRVEGFAAAREEGLEAGRIEGIRQATKTYSREETHDVSSLIDQRLADKALVSPSEQEIRAEAKALMDEVLSDVFPETNGKIDGPNFSIRYMPGNRTFIVHADGTKQGELALYLKSPEDFRIWKEAGSEDAVGNGPGRIVPPRTASGSRVPKAGGVSSAP